MDQVIREKFGLIFEFSFGIEQPDAEYTAVEQLDVAQHVRKLEHSILCFIHTFKQPFFMDEAFSFGFAYVYFFLFLVF